MTPDEEEAAELRLDESYAALLDAIQAKHTYATEEPVTVEESAVMNTKTCGLCARVLVPEEAGVLRIVRIVDERTHTRTHELWCGGCRVLDDLWGARHVRLTKGVG